MVNEPILISDFKIVAYAGSIEVPATITLEIT